MSNVSVAILLTCYNRKNTTRRCLESLVREKYENITYEVYLVDDCSTDGTAEMIKEEFPEIHYIRSEGNLFWNKGMHLAFKCAAEVGYDFYLWVNDDSVFDPHIIKRLVDFYFEVRKKPETIVTGYMESPDRKVVTYPAFIKKKSIIPLATERVLPSDKPVKCVTMHGNCVLIHSSVVDRIGIMDPYYSHGIGDADYGHTATRNGCDIWLTTFPAGVCEANLAYQELYRKNLSLVDRFKFITNRKQRPVKDWWHFTTKNGGCLGVIRFVMGYAKIPLIHIKCKYLGKGIESNAKTDT